MEFALLMKYWRQIRILGPRYQPCGWFSQCHRWRIHSTRVNNSLRVLNLINKALRRIPTSGLCDMHSRRLQNPFKDLMNHTDYFLFHVNCWPQSVLRHCRRDGRRHTYSLPHNSRISQLRASQKSDPLSKMHSICSIWTEIKVALTRMAR